ncbi:MAG TPA: hypothetical protein GXZ98_10360 [Firmicutes bacterium]|nr:hypothetical protein [Bacillota bacterium]
MSGLEQRDSAKLFQLLLEGSAEAYEKWLDILGGILQGYDREDGHFFVSTLSLSRLLQLLS